MKKQALLSTDSFSRWPQWLELSQNGNQGQGLLPGLPLEGLGAQAFCCFHGYIIGSWISINSWNSGVNTRCRHGRNSYLKF